MFFVLSSLSLSLSLSLFSNGAIRKSSRSIVRNSFGIFPTHVKYLQSSTNIGEQQALGGHIKVPAQVVLGLVSKLTDLHDDKKKKQTNKKKQKKQKKQKKTPSLIMTLFFFCYVCEFWIVFFFLSKNPLLMSMFRYTDVREGVANVSKERTRERKESKSESKKRERAERSERKEKREREKKEEEEAEHRFLKNRYIYI